MSESPDSTTQLQRWLQKLSEGDSAAIDALLEHACERLRKLTRKMLHGYPDLRRWEQTDDVLQKALMRLSRALARLQPETVAVFFKLSSKLIKQELIDLCRHYLGPRGLGANHDSHADLVAVVDRVRAMSNFHELVENLSDEEREVVDLLFYQGMTAQEASAALKVSERTVKRRWRSARLTLHKGLQEDGFFP